jgi:oxaloacetate decarboxylase beta subunit
MFDILKDLIFSSGAVSLTGGNLVMWLVAFVLLYLAIKKQYEPLLLLPIAFGILVVNLPLTFLMEPEHGLIWFFYHFGIERDIIPPLIFLGLGAMIDFGPLIANPKTLLLGAGAQAGLYVTFFAAILFGFDLKEAGSIAIIGGADGPTTIYLTSKLAPHLLGATAVSAYAYMALVPIIQPPMMKLLTTDHERKIVMSKLRPVSKLQRVCFPIVTAMTIMLVVPPAAPLISMLMLGNLFKESGVVERLTNASSNELMNIVTIFLGLSVGATMTANTFLNPKVLFIFFLGLFAFVISTAAGLIMGQDQPVDRCSRGFGRADGGALCTQGRLGSQPAQLPADVRHGPERGRRYRNSGGCGHSAEKSRIIKCFVKKPKNNTDKGEKQCLNYSHLSPVTSGKFSSPRAIKLRLMTR